MAECACGCGGLRPPLDARGRPRKFQRGHNLKGGDHWVRQGIKKTWAGNRSGNAGHRTGQSAWLGRKHTEETKAKLRAARLGSPGLSGPANPMYGRTGEANPNWKGGTSPERQRIYASSEWRAVARAVRKRDGHRCTSCGTPGGRLHVHHLKPWATYPDLRLEPTNLVTLCKPCHNDAHRKVVMPS